MLWIIFIFQNTLNIYTHTFISCVVNFIFVNLRYKNKKSVKVPLTFVQYKRTFISSSDGSRLCKWGLMSLIYFLNCTIYVGYFILYKYFIQKKIFEPYKNINYFHYDRITVFLFLFIIIV
jgi:hypothetical protein